MLLRSWVQIPPGPLLPVMELRHQIIYLFLEVVGQIEGYKLQDPLYPAFQRTVLRQWDAGVSIIF
jgi:hypothetical protein